MKNEEYNFRVAAFLGIFGVFYCSVFPLNMFRGACGLAV